MSSIIKVNYNSIINIKIILLTSCLSVLLISMLVYLNPANHGWWSSPEFSWSNLLQFIFIDQILIECITIFITFSLLKIYAEKLNLTTVKASRSNLVKYELNFLPVPFLAFFLFNPFTQTARYLYHYFPNLDWQIYWDGYFYSSELYLTYLPIIFLQVYGVINYNLLKQKSTISNRNNKEIERAFIEVSTPKGKRLLDKKDIRVCEKRDRKYYIYCELGLFTTTLTISQLEAILSPSQFIRINRSTIVKIDAIKSYSFWENDKYVVRIEGDREFTMSRGRLNAIKDRLSLKKT